MVNKPLLKIVSIRRFDFNKFGMVANSVRGGLMYSHRTSVLSFGENTASFLRSRNVRISRGLTGVSPTK